MMGGLEYLDFDLLVEHSQGGYRSRVLNSPAGQAQAEFSLPFSSVELENFYLRVGRPRLGVRRIDSPEMEAAKRFGSRLFESLFNGDVYACLRSSLSEARTQGKGLRLRLRVSAPELTDHPWEYLYNPRLNRFLCLSNETPLVRYLELASPVTALTVSPPLNLLVMVAGPHDYPTLDTGREWEKLVNGLDPLVRAGQVRMERVEPPTLEALQRQLRRGVWHIFHFIGHGAFDSQMQDGLLLMENGQGRGHRLSGQYLGTLLHDHRPLRLVLLNACEGARTSCTDPFAGLAQSLVQQGIPAVIAMQFEITDEAAITFAQEFYSAIADGYPVDAALSEARKAIFAKGNDIEWGTPVYFTRTPDGHIFDVNPEKTLVAGTPKPITDPRLEKELARLYDDGLSAYWLKDWERASTILTHLLTLQPNYPGAVGKLAEADFQSGLARRYAEAKKHLDAQEWSTAVEILQGLENLEPGYEDAASLLENARLQLQVSELAQEANRLYDSRHWQAVVKVFDEISHLAPGYKDTQGMLENARAALAEEIRQEKLDEDYRQALLALEAKDYQAARTALIEIQEQAPDFRDSAGLLQRTEKEIERRQYELQHQEQIQTLYTRAQGLARRRQWGEALEKMETIKKLEPSFDDPDGVENQARTEISREQAEAQRQQLLASLYAEAVKQHEAGQFQAALEKWGEVRSHEPTYPDRQKVETRARKQLQAIAKKAGPKKILPHWLPRAAILAATLVVIGIVIAVYLPALTPRTTPTQPVAASVRQATITLRPTNIPPTRPAEVLAAQTKATSKPTTPPTRTTRPQPTRTRMIQQIINFRDTFTQADGSDLSQSWTIDGLSDSESSNDVHIQDGQVYVYVEGKDLDVLVRPNLEVNLQTTRRLYFESDIMMDKSSYGGHFGLILWIGGRYINCSINAREYDYFSCWNDELLAKQGTKWMQITPGTWHNIRVVLDSYTSRYEVYVDGEFFDEVALDLSWLSSSDRNVNFAIQLMNRSEKSSTGYFDNLEISPLE